MEHQGEQTEPFSFANNFWGKEENGVHVLLGHINNTKHTADEIRAFYKERASIEEEYSRRLIALSRKGLGAHEVGTLKTALETIRSTTENLGKSHLSAAHQFKADLEEPLSAFAGNIRSRRKTVQVMMEKLTKGKMNQQNQVERAREKFEGDCNKINGYFAQQNLLLGKELERNNHKLDKAHVSIEVTKRDYQNSIRLLGETLDRWNKEWKVSCDKLQDLEEERVNFLKSNLWAYTNVVSTVCVSDDEGCENIRVALEKCDVTKDVETFVRERATGPEIMDPPEFVNFMSGNSHNSKERTYKIAQFSRVSTLEENQDYFDPNASMMGQSMARTAPSLARSSAASCISEATDAQTVVIKKGATSSMMPSVYEDNHDPNSMSMGSVDSDGQSLQAIPVLAHSHESDMTPQTSPTQKSLMSRTGSFYSSTSASSQSDLEQVNEQVYQQQQKPYNAPITPMIQEPAAREPSPQPSFQQEPESSPRRTWASPFRRRSKKDLKKGWNPNGSNGSNGSDSNDRTTTMTSRSPFGFNRETESESQSAFRTPIGSNVGTPSGSPSKVKASTMLSMGDNMFDLGVSPNRSPFDQRAKSASPTKSLAADDPLVMALEKLKVTGGSSAPDQEEHQSGQYGDMGNNTPLSKPKRISSRSAPASPARHNESARYSNGPGALIPPQPAFTAKDMKTTSRQYNNQKQEMFEYDDPNQQRPRSNTGGSFRGPHPQERTVSPQPSQQNLQHRPSQRPQQRPQSMYDVDSYQQQPSPSRGGYRNSGNHPDFERRGSYDNRGGSPNPGYYNNAPSRGNSVSPAPYANGNPMDRSASPNPMMRSPSPNPMMRSGSPNPAAQQGPPRNMRSVSPNPMMQQQAPHDMRHSASPNPGFQPPQPQYVRKQPSQNSMYQRSGSPMDYNSRGGIQGPPRSVSPQPYQPPQNNYQRAGSARGNYYSGHSQYDLDTPPSHNGPGGPGPNGNFEPPRSRSAMNMRGGAGGSPGGPGGLPNVSRDGRPIVRYARALYDYRAAIPEEVSFRTGDVLLVIRVLEDGWWECESLNDGRIGLAPGNFLKNM